MTDGRTDGRTDGGDCNIPYAFLKKRGDNKVRQIRSISSYFFPLLSVKNLIPFV